MSHNTSNANVTDYSPYHVTAQDNYAIQLQLQSSYKLWWLLIYRLFPLFIFMFLVLGAQSVYEDIGNTYGFVAIYLFAAIGMIILLNKKYVLSITLMKNNIVRKVQSTFTTIVDVEEINSDKLIMIKKNKGFNSESWGFYLLKNTNKRLLFHIPIIFKKKTEVRDKFKQAIEKYCKTEIVCKS
jgi:hypothetical protein